MSRFIEITRIIEGSGMLSGIMMEGITIDTDGIVIGRERGEVHE